MPFRLLISFLFTEVFPLKHLPWYAVCIEDFTNLGVDLGLRLGLLRPCNFHHSHFLLHCSTHFLLHCSTPCYILQMCLQSNWAILTHGWESVTLVLHMLWRVVGLVCEIPNQSWARAKTKSKRLLYNDAMFDRNGTLLVYPTEAAGVVRATFELADREDGFSIASLNEHACIVRALRIFF